MHLFSIPTHTHAQASVHKVEHTHRHENAHTGNRTPVTSMEGLYDATTLCVQLPKFLPYILRFQITCAFAKCVSPQWWHCQSLRFHPTASKCRDPGSNRGPSDLRSDALPTELSRLSISGEHSTAVTGCITHKCDHIFLFRHLDSHTNTHIHPYTQTHTLTHALYNTAHNTRHRPASQNIHLLRDSNPQSSD